MSTFKEIRGQLIKSVSSDPSPISNGDIWYNSTSQTLKGVQGIGAWASGGNYPTGTYGLQGSGTQTATLGWCGDAGGATTAQTYEYNGTSWTGGGNYPYSGWRIAGDGTQTATISAGGVNNGLTLQSVTSNYNGSSWTSGTALPAVRRSFGLVGTQTAAVAFMGAPVATTLEYNGSSWTSANAMSTPRAGAHALGTQTAALAGATPPSLNTEEYDGTNWTTGGAQTVATGSSAEGNGTGTQTAGLFVGGYPNITTTQLYNGSTFSTSASLGSGGYGIAQSGSSSTAALAFGGYRSGYSNSTEEYTVAATTKTFTTS